MTTLTAEDVRARPGEFVIVARSARGHAHISVDEFDRLLERIGQSAEIHSTSDDLMALRQICADQQRMIDAVRKDIDAIRNKVDAIIAIANETTDGRSR